MNLLVALVETERPLSRVELFERVPGYDNTPASRRAFERDKEMLRSVGVPVATETIESDNPEEQLGYRVPKADYQLAETGLTPEEVSALSLAAAAVRIEEGSTAGALLKLGADPEVATGEEVALADDDHLADFFAARRDRCTTEFEHNGKQRVVDPYRLSFRRGRWYMTGYDHSYGTERTYRIDRVTSAVKLRDPKSFEPPASTGNTWLAGFRYGDDQTEPFTARLWVDADHAELVMRQTGDDCLSERRDDGSVVLDIEVANRSAFSSWVLDFLDHVEILQPQDLRDEFVASLERLVSP